MRFCLGVHEREPNEIKSNGSGGRLSGGCGSHSGWLLLWSYLFGCNSICSGSRLAFFGGVFDVVLWVYDDHLATDQGSLWILTRLLPWKGNRFGPSFLFRPMNGTLVVCYFCFSIRWLRTSRSLVKRAFRKFTSGGVISRQISGAESLASKITSPLQSLFNRDPIQMKFSNYFKKFF